MDDPEQRFQSVDIRKPLMLALAVAEASIVDELPKGFRLPEGELQSRQEPVLSRKVIREALANAVMHRSYQEHSPIQIIRYSNRIEILNPGYSLVWCQLSWPVSDNYLGRLAPLFFRGRVSCILVWEGVPLVGPSTGRSP